MQWTDQAIVLGVRRHGEGAAIAELLTLDHGRHLGLVRGGAGARMQPVLQRGNTVQVTWRARLDEHLGTLTVDGMKLRAGSLLPFAHALHCLNHLAALVQLLPERDPHPDVYRALERVLDGIDARDPAAILLVEFELMMLAELGFGLDLQSCAATGEQGEALIYVSPRSGRAVSREAGEEWQARLLRLPPFMRAGGSSSAVGPHDLVDALALTAFFLRRWAFEPRGLTLPDARERFAALVAAGAKKAPAGLSASVRDG